MSSTDTPLADSDHPATKQTKNRAPLILVVAEDRDLREMLRRLLQTGGYDVVVAETAAAALRMLATWKPELILIDLMMPLIVGEAVVRIVRQRTLSANTPLVVLTAFSDAFGAAIKAAGATEVLQKPRDLPRLVETVNRLLGRAAP